MNFIKFIRRYQFLRSNYVLVETDTGQRIELKSEEELSEKDIEIRFDRLNALPDESALMAIADRKEFYARLHELAQENPLNVNETVDKWALRMEEGDKQIIEGVR